MNGDRFDQLARLVARLADCRQSRRSILRTAAAGAGATVLSTSHVSAAPDHRSAIRARNQEAGTDPLIDETAFNLEYDLGKIFQFVRDEVGYDPYAGVLRGAKGTLWGLAGNSADQAMLLAALLNASMIQTRFAFGKLPDDAAEKLLASLRLDEGTVRARADRVLMPGVLEGEIEPAELTVEEEHLLALLTKADDRFQEIVERQSKEGLATVLGALDDAGITLSEPGIALQDLERMQHVWVQYANGPEWIDLDPSIPNAERGTVYAETTESRDQLPEEFFHRISMRLVAEKVVGGAPKRGDLLAFEATSAELVGVPITLMHPNADSLKAAGVAIQNVIGGYRNFIPSLIVGNQSQAGQPVTFVTGEGALGAFDVTSIEGDTLGEWLEIEVRTPGGSRQITRELFDRVGLARRGAGSIDLGAISPVELVDTGSAAPGYPPLNSALSIGIVSGIVPWRYFEADEETQDPLVALSRAVHVYHYIRDVLALESAELNGQRFSIDEPNVTAVLQAEFTSTADEQISTLLMDLIHRHFVAVPVEGVETRMQSQVAAGIFGHAVERALIETAGAELLGLPIDDFMSVGRVFEEAQQQDIPVRVLTPGASNAAPLSLDEAARLRIEAALADGYTVIVPERSVAIGNTVRSGWWLVDPKTGATQDQLDDGRGTTLVDYAFTIARIMICAAAAFHALGLVSLIHTYGAGNQLQEQWIKNRVKKLSISGGLCLGSFAV
jgi:transglutaminase-like putative cysteine protease